MEAFIGTIVAVGFNYAPRGWAFCNGQLLPIAQYNALFSLLGTAYGGDGRTTFGLPDLRGRVAVGSQGAGPGLTPIQQGEMAGSNNVTVTGTGAVTVSLSAANLPAHTHAAAGLTASTSVNVSTGVGTANAMTAGATLASTPAGGAGALMYLPAGTAPTSPTPLGNVSSTVSGATASTGSGTPLAAPVQTQAQASVMQPYTGLNYIIALEGLFPTRD